MRENSTRRRQSEATRRRACTWLARMVGSEPKAGSSPTTKFCRVKPGMGSRSRVTASMWTGRPRLAPMLVAICLRKRFMLMSGEEDDEQEDDEEHAGGDDGALAFGVGEGAGLEVFGFEVD